MTNHDRFVKVFKNRVGQKFSTREIGEIMQRESDINPGSIRPNDMLRATKVLASVPEKRCVYLTGLSVAYIRLGQI